MAASLADLVKLLAYTARFHLGNRLPTFNSGARRQLRFRCNGRQLVVRFRQDAGDLSVLYEVFGSQIYHAPYEALGRVKTIVDLGAHIGLATLYFATLFPDAMIASVEPMPDNFALLRTNCLANGIGATIVNSCIGKSSGDILFYPGPATHLHSAVAKSPGTAPIAVRMVSMARLLSETGIGEVDILKVDIEGGEEELFANCGSWVKQVRAIIIEIHPPVVDYAGVIREITSHGFEYYPPGGFAPLYDVFLRRDLVETTTRRPRAAPRQADSTRLFS